MMCDWMATCHWWNTGWYVGFTPSITEYPENETGAAPIPPEM